jgi:cytochrome c2
MAYLTYLGASAGSPTSIDLPTPKSVQQQGGQMLAQFEAGRAVAAQSGCLACHKFGENGNDGPGPNLTDIGQRLKAQAIARTLINPTAQMTSFKDLPEDKFNNLVVFLSNLK